jgi:hypothetical protein
MNGNNLTYGNVAMSQTRGATDPDDLLRKGIWLYFILLIIEGALRKWVLPGLATPLLIIRDPIAIWLVYTAWNRRLLPTNYWVASMMIIGAIGIVTTLLFGHGNPFVAVYGARAYLIHFPMILVMGVLLRREDVIAIGKVVLYISIGMFVVIALQFYTPQSSFINRGVGGDTEGSGFSGALGFFRPSGTFSFSNGVTSFFSFASCFIIYFWLKPDKVNKTVLIGATLSLLAAIPLSISRGLLFAVAVTVLFAFVSVTFNPRLLGKVVVATVAIIFTFIALSFTDVFQTAMGALLARFDSASASEGTIGDTLMNRYLGGLLRAFSLKESQPIFGYGLGLLSNVGTMLLRGKVVGGVSEGEWGRGIYELGAMFGLGIVFIRMGFSFIMAKAAFSRLLKGDVLPWLLLSFFLLNVPQGNWSQPTALGFCIVIGGLLLASMKPEMAPTPELKTESIKS